MIKKITLRMITLVFTFTALLSGCANKGIPFHESINPDNKAVQTKLIKYMDGKFVTTVMKIELYFILEIYRAILHM